MSWLQAHIISLTVFLPTLGALFIALLPADKIYLMRRVAMIFSLLTFGLAVWLFIQFQSNADFQLLLGDLRYSIALRTNTRPPKNTFLRLFSCEIHRNTIPIKPLQK